VDKLQIAEHLRFFQELGVTGVSGDARWRLRAGSRATSDVQGATCLRATCMDPGTSKVEATPRVAPSVSTSHESTLHVAPRTLHVIRADLGDCTRCKLHAQGRTQIVFGVGNPAADLMFVGEAPGGDEDVQGIPFVGRAGQLLTKMIEAMGFSRDEVYIANVVKCRPPENRNPEPDEIASCEPFLFRQIETIKPKVIVALGSFAAKTLLRTQEPISRLRGRVYDYHGAKLVPTFHPSFLLRSPGQKKYAWEDLKVALGVMGRQPPSAG
jgi:uracil-DNA glycosylase family 4